MTSSVDNMAEAFQYSTALGGEVEVNANTTDYTNCFNGTTKTIILKGICNKETKTNLASTSTRGNVTFQNE